MYPCPHRLDAARCPLCLHARIEDLQKTITELRVKIIDSANQEARICALEVKNVLMEKELAVAGRESVSLLERLHDLEYYKPVKGGA
jgi:hypothetical protein